MATLEDIIAQLNRIEQIAADITNKLMISGDQIVVVGGMSDISDDLGLMKAGEFRSGVGIPGRGFTGVRIGAPGWTYNTHRYAIVGLSNDVLQFGLSVEDGHITTQSGDIGGWTITADTIQKTGIILDSGDDTIYVGAADPRIIIDGGNSLIKSSNYSSGASGFQILGSSGNAEFNDILARGEIRSAVFTYGELSGVAGGIGVFKSSGKLRSAVTTVASPTTFNLDIEDPESGHVALFEANDILRMKVGGSDNWVTVSSVSDQTTFYRYVCTLSSGSATTFNAGTGVMDYGISGQGFLIMSADDADGPYYAVRTHAGSPWSATSEVVRLGNMSNSFGTGDNDRYGFAVGDYTGGNYLSYNAESTNFVIHAGNGAVQLDESGIKLVSSTTASDVRSLNFMYTNGDIATQLQTFVNTSGTGMANARLIVNSGDDYSWSDGGIYIQSISEVGGVIASPVVSVSASSNYSPYGDVPCGVINIDGANNGWVWIHSELFVTLWAGDGTTSFKITPTAANFDIPTNFNDPVYCSDTLTVDSGNLKSYANATSYTGYIYVPLATAVGSVSWNGDSFSTTAKTVIDLSTDFGLPPLIKAVDVQLIIRDSASAASDCYVILSNNDIAGNGKRLYAGGWGNDRMAGGSCIVPCDANGDIYYQILASGVGTMDVFLSILGYWI